MTDEARVYKTLGREYAEHSTTHHKAKQYVDFTDRSIHTNTVEGAFSIFKRDMKGRLSALRRAAPSPLSRRVRVPL